MKRKWRQVKVNNSGDLDELIEEITLDAYGEDEQLSAFCQVLEDEVPLPAGAFVIGEPVTIVEIDYNGNERRGLTAKCRRTDGSEHLVGAVDVMFPQNSKGARYLAAYRKWLGLESYPTQVRDSRRKRQHKATSSSGKERVGRSRKRRVTLCRKKE
jgi:hypothetical protein